MTWRLSPLELRLERIKRLDGAQFYYLKRLYQWPMTIEDYMEHRLEAHLHAKLLDSILVCATYRSRGDVRSEGVADDGQFVVLVEIADSSESLRPVDSLVRLQPLNGCDMRVTQS